MGGFAVVVDWERPIDPTEVMDMMALVPHRTTGGTVVDHSPRAAMAEGRYAHIPLAADAAVTRLGPFSVVGHINLLRRSRLRDCAGGLAATDGMNDRMLLLAAYRRSGMAFLDAIDGDYAFVLWDGLNETAIAVRDRFAVRGLFFETTPTGVRFASEVKQLAGTSPGPLALNDHIVGEYLANDFRETRDTFFRGIERVRGSDALVFTRDSRRRIRYWDPDPELDHTMHPDDVVRGTRELLVDSVRRRLRWADRSVAHLSGGLDSSTVVTAAQLIHRDEPDAVHLETVSAVYPGHSNDETEWIDDLVAGQPFRHHRFVPRIASIEQFDDDMWVRDHPWIDRDRDQWFYTAEIARESGATQVLTGVGGDHLLDETWIIADRLRRARVRRAWNGMAAQARWTGYPTSKLAANALRRATPSWARRSVRAVIPRGDGLPPLLSSDLAARLRTRHPVEEPVSFGGPSLTADSLGHHARAPMASWIMESHDAGLATQNLEETNPYFDRALYEFVASVPAEVYPLDGRSKVLARLAFADELPASIRDGRTKTIADQYVRFLFGHHAPHYRERYPDARLADDHLDPDEYTALLRRYDAGDIAFEDEQSLWHAWTYLAFRDGLTRYRRT